MTVPAPPPSPFGSRTPDRLDGVRRRLDAQTTDALTLTGLAASAGLSAYHFARQFTARYGVSPMAYVRRRRLVAAASRLSSDTAPSLIELAFDSGFDSQEGFTRAFKRAFGVSPGRYRRSGALVNFEESAALTDATPAQTSLTQSPAPVEGAGLRLAGLSAVFDDMTKAGIPGLWGRLVPRLPLEGQDGWGTFGLCMAVPEAGAMRYMAAVALTPEAPAPAGLEIIDLPPRRYLVFRQVLHGGALHPQMQRAAKEIWGERLPSSGHRLAQAPDLEVYPPDFEPNRAGDWVEWWIPIET